MQTAPHGLSESLRDDPHPRASARDLMRPNAVESERGDDKEAPARHWAFRRGKSAKQHDQRSHRSLSGSTAAELTLDNISHKNVVQALEHVRELQDDARLILAAEFLKKAEAVILDPVLANANHIKLAKGLLLGEMREKLEDLRVRAAECSDTLQEWESEDWIVSQTMMGVTTSYKKDPNGSLWVKLNGVMEDVPVFDQMATVREVDLFELWVPFCRQAYLLKRLGRVEMLTYFNVSVPGLSRDAVLHAYACDCLLENACVLIQGRSVDSWQGVEMPPIRGWGHDRMIVHGFKARIELLSPTAASTSLQANVDPKAPLPQMLIDFVMRRVAGMMLYFLVRAARKIGTQPDNPHRRRIQDDTDFYADWMLPKFEAFCASRGWPYSPPHYLSLEGPSSSSQQAEPPRTAAATAAAAAAAMAREMSAANVRTMNGTAQGAARFPTSSAAPVISPQRSVNNTEVSSVTGSAVTNKSKKSLARRAKGLFKRKRRSQPEQLTGASSSSSTSTSNLAGRAAVAGAAPLPTLVGVDALGSDEHLDVDPRLLAKYAALKERKRQRSGQGLGRDAAAPSAAANGSLGALQRSPANNREQRWLRYSPLPSLSLPLYAALSNWSALWSGARGWVLGFAAEALMRALLLQVLLVAVWHRTLLFGPEGNATFAHTKAFIGQYLRFGAAITSAVTTTWAALAATWRVAMLRFWHKYDDVGLVEWQAVASDSMAGSAVLVAVVIGALLLALAWAQQRPIALQAPRQLSPASVHRAESRPGVLASTPAAGSAIGLGSRSTSSQANNVNGRVN